MFLISFVQKSYPLQEVGIHHFLKCNFLKGKNWRRWKKYLWLKDRKKNATKKSQKKEANGNMLGKWVNLTVPSILQPRYNPKDHHIGDIRGSSPVVDTSVWIHDVLLNKSKNSLIRRHGITKSDMTSGNYCLHMYLLTDACKKNNQLFPSSLLIRHLVAANRYTDTLKMLR